MAKFIGKANDGFEPGWQIVPLSGQKEITLQGGSGLDVVDGGAHKKIIALKETTHGGNRLPVRRFMIKGVKRGKTVVWAKDKAKLAAQIVVEVKPQRVVTIALNYVEDKAGHKTKRSPDTAGALLKKINDIYLPQANVKFRKVSAGILKINEDLGPIVMRDRKTPSKDKFSVLIANRVPGAQINVFFVWECEKAGLDADVEGHAEIAISRNEKTNCMVEDSLGTLFERVVAHEVGHNLGLKDHYTNPKLLMYGKKEKINGILLTRSEILSICAQ